MELFGSAAFGFVVGWAACFAAGWRPSVLLVRIGWIAALSALFAIAQLPHFTVLAVTALAGGMAHIVFAVLIRSSRIPTEKASA